MALHLCEDHARVYLAQGGEQSAASTLGNMLAQHLKIEQSTEKISESEKKTCPICGITFAQFRSSGRLGCAYDYVCFQEELEPLLINIHGGAIHRGKRPARSATAQGKQRELIQLRREMEEAIEREDYEAAGRLRDQIKAMENPVNAGEESSE